MVIRTTQASVMSEAAAWGVGLEVLCKKGQRQQGSWEAWAGTACYQPRHGLSPATTSTPCKKSQPRASMCQLSVLIVDWG